MAYSKHTQLTYFHQVISRNLKLSSNLPVTVIISLASRCCSFQSAGSPIRRSASPLIRRFTKNERPHRDRQTGGRTGRLVLSDVISVLGCPFCLSVTFCFVSLSVCLGDTAASATATIATLRLTLKHVVCQPAAAVRLYVVTYSCRTSGSVSAVMGGHLRAGKTFRNACNCCSHTAEITGRTEAEHKTPHNLVTSPLIYTHSINQAGLLH